MIYISRRPHDYPLPFCSGGNITAVPQATTVVVLHSLDITTTVRFCASLARQRPENQRTLSQRGVDPDPPAAPGQCGGVGVVHVVGPWDPCGRTAPARDALLHTTSPFCFLSALWVHVKGLRLLWRERRERPPQTSFTAFHTPPDLLFALLLDPRRRRRRPWATSSWTTACLVRFWVIARCKMMRHHTHTCRQRAPAHRRCYRAMQRRKMTIW